MNVVIKTLIVIMIVRISYVDATETCSRVAIINHQEILTDTNTGNKGEGLRYYLERDEVAKKYLNIYQDGTQIKTINTVLGSIGTIFLLSGVISNNSSGLRDNFLIGGATAISLNFLITKTLNFANESNLENAINEYNKRHLPRIYFNPNILNKRLNSGERNFYINRTWRF